MLVQNLSLFSNKLLSCFINWNYVSELHNLIYEQLLDKMLSVTWNSVFITSIKPEI